VLLFIVGMFVTVSLTAHGKDINPQKAAKIAKRYVTLSRNSDTKVQTRGIQGTAETPYYIFKGDERKVKTTPSTRLFFSKWIEGEGI